MTTPARAAALAPLAERLRELMASVDRLPRMTVDNARHRDGAWQLAEHIDLSALDRPARAQAGDVLVTEAQRREIAEAWRELVRHTPSINGHDRMADALTALGGEDG